VANALNLFRNGDVGIIDWLFTTLTPNGRERLWLLTAYDVKEGRVEYVFISPGFTANEIKIQVVPDGVSQSKATITYRHFALAPDGNREVEKLDAHWGKSNVFIGKRQSMRP
jgi:hypothetical protein